MHREVLRPAGEHSEVSRVYVEDHILRANETDLQDLGRGWGACYSPSGQRMAIARRDELVVYDAGGDEVHSVSVPISTGTIEWAHEDQVIFVAERALRGKPGGEICVLNLDDGAVTKTGIIASIIELVAVTREIDTGSE